MILHSPFRMRAAVALLVLTLTGCEREAPAPRGEPVEPSAPEAAGAPPLIPADATFDQVNAVVREPVGDELPADSLLAEQIRLGFRIIENTPQHAPEYSGNDLSCGNCHLNAGQRLRGLPYVGIAATFPEPRRREGRLFSLEDRIRGCFMRSMNGVQPPYDSPELLAVSAYIHWLSEGQPIGESPEWRGQNVIAEENLIPIEELDPVRGRQLYAQYCVACHGADGQGVDLQSVKPGPLWGPRSWNDGAGLSRVYTLAGYLRYAMPLTQPGVLTDEEAQHVAAYITAQDRPSYPGKANDYPGGAPVDAVYYPQYPENPLVAKLRAAADTN